MKAALIMKENINKLDFLKDFCSSDDMMKSVPRQARGGEETFAVHMSSKEFTSRICNKVRKVSTEKDSLFFKWTDNCPMRHSIIEYPSDQ